MIRCRALASQTGMLSKVLDGLKSGGLRLSPSWCLIFLHFLTDWRARGLYEGNFSRGKQAHLQQHNTMAES